MGDWSDGGKVKSRIVKRKNSVGFGNRFRSPVLGNLDSDVYLKI